MPREKAVKVRKWVTCAEPGCKRRAGTSKPYCGEHQKQFDKVLADRAKERAARKDFPKKEHDRDPAVVAKRKKAAALRKKLARAKKTGKKPAAEKAHNKNWSKRKNDLLTVVHATGSRLIKAYCEKCGYTIRLSRKWIDVRRPMCPVCMRNMATAIDGEPNLDPRQLNLKEAGQ